MVDATSIGDKCQFKFRLGEGAECSRPAARGGFCVFHAPKHSSAEKRSLPADERGVETAFEEQFRQELSVFLNGLEGVPNDEPIDFRGFEFPEFTLGENVSKKVLFTGATFHQDVKFSNVTFRQGADFSHARFREGADFGHATFEQKVSFYGTTFDKSLVASANFTLTTFNEDANFSHSTFNLPAYFGGAIFGKDKNTTFYDVRFNDVVNFQDTEFNGWTVFKAYFEQDANFSDAKFNRDVNFKGSTFSKSQKTDFRSAKFFGADFTDITFHQRTDFSDTTFQKAVKFNNVTFCEEAYFRDSTFLQMVYFQHAHFQKGADFSEVLFRHIADFSDATFSGKTRFARGMRRAFFEGETDVVMDFLGEGRFRRLNLEEGAEIAFDKVNLSQATFLDTDVEGFIFRDVRWFHPESRVKRWFRDSLVSYIRSKRGAPAELPTLHEEEDIRDRQHWFIKRYIRQLEAEIGKDNRSEAADAKTAGQSEEKSQGAEEQTQSGDAPKAIGKTTPPVKAKIRLTIRDRVLYRFRSVVLKWTDPTNSSGNGLGREQALWDEFYNVLDVSEKDYEKIAENYRQLVLNYEKKRDYDVAEDFHFGEMHMRRKGKEASRRRWMPSRWVNGHSIYWLSSGYGTSYRRALLIFAILFLLVSAAFQYSGFQLVEPKSGDVVRTIEYEVLPKVGHHTVSFWQWLADYGQALIYTLSLITFQKGDVYRPLGDMSRLWLAVGTATLAGQAALFFLAIRRRFKR